MVIPDNYQFFCPVKISAGNKALEHLPMELEGLDVGKPFVVAQDRGAAKTALKAFRNSGMTIGLCDSLPALPDSSVVGQLAALYRDKQCDALVAVGSGALVDTAKAVNLLVSSESGDLEKFAGENKVPGPLNPLVLVLTAAGNGLESSRFASLGDLAFSSPFLMPDVVVVDRRMNRVDKTAGLMYLALASLTHAVEVYSGPAKNPMTDAYAYGAIRMIMENLVAVISGDGTKAGPSALVSAAAMAGCALSNAQPGMIHLIGEAAGDEWDLALGQVLGILLPHVMDYHAHKNDYHSAALLLPLAGNDVYASTAKDLRAAIAVNMVHALLYDLNKAAGGQAMPLTLKEAGVDQGSLSTVAERAAGIGPGSCDPKAVHLILEHAWSGYPIVSL